MTHLRTPETFAHAATEIAGRLGHAEAARIARRSVRTIHAWSHPDGKTTPTLRQASALDAAFIARGGEHAPFARAMAAAAEERVAERSACQIALASELAEAARECGDAIASGMALVHGTGSINDSQRALLDADEAVGAFTAVARRLRSFLTPGAGPGFPGGPK